MDTLTIIGFVQSIVGIVLASIALIWNIRRDLRDRGRLIVRAGFYKLVPDPDGTGTVKLAVTITNVGRRPVTIINWGGLQKDGMGFILKPRNLPIKLNESESVREYTHDFSFLNEELVYLCAMDSADKRWKVNKGDFKRIMSGKLAKGGGMRTKRGFWAWLLQRVRPRHAKP